MNDNHKLTYYDDGVEREFVCRNSDGWTSIILDSKTDGDKIKYCPFCGEEVT